MIFRRIQAKKTARSSRNVLPHPCASGKSDMFKSSFRGSTSCPFLDTPGLCAGLFYFSYRSWPPGSRHWLQIPTGAGASPQGEPEMPQPTVLLKHIRIGRHRAILRPKVNGGTQGIRRARGVDTSVIVLFPGDDQSAGRFSNEIENYASTLVFPPKVYFHANCGRRRF